VSCASSAKSARKLIN